MGEGGGVKGKVADGGGGWRRCADFSQYPDLLSWHATSPVTMYTSSPARSKMDPSRRVVFEMAHSPLNGDLL